MDLARAPRRTARKKGSGYENVSLLEGIYVGINISKVLNFKNVLKMLVIIGPHFLNTLQARVIRMKLYCDDVMGGSTRRRTPTLLPWFQRFYFYYFHCEGERKNKPPVESGN